MADGIEVRVENQLVRFVCPEPVGHQEMIEQLDAQPSGNVVIKALENPRATIIVDEEGRIIVHGVHRVEAATAAAKEVLLRLGRDDTGLISEPGPVIASFDFPVRFNFQNVKSKLGSGKTKFDDRLGCLRVEDTRHDLELLIWPSGRCVALQATHPNIVAMAGVHWLGLFRDMKCTLEDQP